MKADTAAEAEADRKKRGQHQPRIDERVDAVTHKQFLALHVLLARILITACTDPITRLSTTQHSRMES